MNQGAENEIGYVRGPRPLRPGEVRQRDWVRHLLVRKEAPSGCLPLGLASHAAVWARRQDGEVLFVIKLSA